MRHSLAFTISLFAVTACHTTNPDDAPTDTATVTDADQDGYPTGEDCDDSNPGAYLWGPTGQSVTLTTQTAIDDFCPGWEEVACGTGAVTDLAITGEQVNDLSPLTCITSIDGTLSITQTADLTSLTGLDGISSIGGNLELSLNTGLVSLQGLNHLTTVGGGVDIYLNSVLPNVDGLALTSVGQYLYITENPELTHLPGLSTLTAVGADLCVGYNAKLTNLDGLESLTTVGSLLVQWSERLTELDGLTRIPHPKKQDA